jgi:hypothetical protein
MGNHACETVGGVERCSRQRPRGTRPCSPKSGSGTLRDMGDSTPCHVCGNSDRNKIHTAREMMFGSREQFVYLECAECGTVQLRDQPTDIHRHYPDATTQATPSSPSLAPERGASSVCARRLHFAHRGD